MPAITDSRYKALIRQQIEKLESYIYDNPDVDLSDELAELRAEFADLENVRG